MKTLYIDTADQKEKIFRKSLPIQHNNLMKEKHFLLRRSQVVTICRQTAPVPEL